MAKLKGGSRVYGNLTVDDVLLVSNDTTITGNLTVTGNTVYTNVDTLAVQDPLISVGGAANNAALSVNDGHDRGLQLHYYDGAAIDGFMGWDNSAREFAFGSNVTITGEVVTFNTYGNLHANYLLGNGSQLTDIDGAHVTGTVAFANVSTYAGTVTASSQPNITSVGTLTGLTVGNSTANTVFGNGTITSDGNITAANFSTAGNLTVTGDANISGNIHITGTLTGNISGTIVAPGLDTYVLYNNGGNVDGTAGLTFNNTTNALSVTGNISGGNLSGTNIAGTLTTASQPNITSVGTLSALDVSGNANVGNLGTGGLIVATGNVTGGNLKTGGLVSATGNVTGGNLTTGGVLDVTGNANVGNLGTGGLIVATGNVSGGNLTTGGAVDATGNVTGGNLKTGGLVDATGNITGGNVRTAGLVIGANVTSNTMLTANNFTINGMITGDLIPATDVAQDLGNATHAWRDLWLSGSSIKLGTQTISSNTTALTTTADLAGGNVLVTNLTTTDTLIANTWIQGTLNANSNAQPNITSVGTLLSLAVTGNITGGNVYANAGTIGANLLTGTLTTNAQPNITSVGTLGNLVVTSNVDVSGTVNTDSVTAKTDNDITITAGATNRNVVLAPTGTGMVDVSGAVITGVGEPTLDNHAATKYYVDQVAQGLHVHAPASVATTANLAGYSANTFTSLANPFVLDTYTVLDGQRVLVKDQGTAAQNGIYTYDAGTDTLTRATDADVAADLAGGDFIFVVNGSTQGDTGWVQTEVVTTLGTDSIIWQQFSGAGAYSGDENKGIHFNGTVVETKVDGSTITWDGSSGNLKVKDGLTLVTPNIGAATGSSLDVGTGNITAGNANISGDLHVTGTISGNISGTIVAPGADTNILFNDAGNVNATAGFTFTKSSNALSVTGNITGGNVYANSGTIGANLLTGTITTAAQPNITSVGTLGNLSVTANISAGNVLSDNYYYANGAPIDFQTAAGNATEVQFKSSAGNDLSASANFTFDTGSSTLTVTNISANGAGLSSLTGANVTGFVPNANVANTAFSVSGANVTGDVSGADHANVADSANSVAGGNVSGEVGSANIAWRVSDSTQGNITSLGTLTGLTVNGLTSLGPVGNVSITGGSSGQYLQTDGAGNLSWHSLSSTSISNGTSNVSVLNNGNVLISSAGNANVVVVTGTGANITGVVDVSGNVNANNINASNIITANAQVDSTSSITGTVKVDGGIAATGNIYTGKSVGFADNNGGSASKAYIQFNATANSLDFIFN